MWQTQAINFTTKNIFNVEFYLQYFIAIKIMTWKFHVYDSTKSRYGIIIGRDLLPVIGLYIKFSDRAILCGIVPYEG